MSYWAKIRVLARALSPEALGKDLFFYFSSTRNSPRSLVYGRIAGTSASMATEPSLTLTTAPHPASSQDCFLNHICKALLHCKSQIPGTRMWMCRGTGRRSVSPTARVLAARITAGPGLGTDSSAHSPCCMSPTPHAAPAAMVLLATRSPSVPTAL